MGLTEDKAREKGLDVQIGKFPFKVSGKGQATTATDGLVKERRSHEKDLDAHEDRISKMKDRASQLKTNQEYQAHLFEVELANKKKGEIEEKILLAMEQIEQLQQKIKEFQAKVGEAEKLFSAEKATLDELECHITTLNPGQTPHEPHKHPDEEIIIIKEGIVESLVNGQLKRVGPGSIIFQAANQLHSIRNVGDTPAVYHVLKWNSPGMLKKKEN